MSKIVIYKPSGKAAEYAAYAANFYVGCSNRCTYCYLKKGRGANVLGGNIPKLKSSLNGKKQPIDIFKLELLQYKTKLQHNGLFFSFTTDPLLPEARELTIQAIELCNNNLVPVKVLSKDAKGLDILMNYAIDHNLDLSKIAIGSTLTGCDDLEPGASPNLSRIESLKRAKTFGFKTFASVEPIPPGRFENAENVIIASFEYLNLLNIGLESGAKYVKKDVVNFWEHVMQYWNERFFGSIVCNNVPKIYLKNSFIKKLGVDRKDLPFYCI